MDFQVEKVLPNGLGRVGTIRTAHGEIKTPAFMAVGTQGYVRFLSAEDLRGRRCCRMGFICGEKVRKSQKREDWQRGVQPVKMGGRMSLGMGQL